MSCPGHLLHERTTYDAKEDIKAAFAVFEASIMDAFEKEGLKHLTNDMAFEMESKKNLLTASLKDPDSGVFFLVAKMNGRLIGTVSFGPCGREIKKLTNCELESIGELGSLYVLPGFQGMGFGSALIHSMMKRLHASGLEQFCLDSGYRHTQKKWLRKFGKPYKIARNYWGKDRHHMIWLCRVIDYVEPPEDEFAEEHYGIKLPQDFVRFYSQYDLPELPPYPLQLDGFYLLDQMIEEYDVRLDEDETIPSKGKLIPFAFDSPINQYCFFYSVNNKNDPMIVWVDSNHAAQDLFREHQLNPEAVIVVRKTFKEFLEDLYIDNM